MIVEPTLLPVLRCFPMVLILYLEGPASLCTQKVYLDFLLGWKPERKQSVVGDYGD